MTAIRIGLVGLGKIARDQHLPALAANPAFVLAAVADPAARHDTLPSFPSLAAMLADGPPLDAVTICTPPRGRLALVQEAIAAGLHVMIEKPPAATLGEAEIMRAAAAQRGVALFGTWHSREAGAVAPARAWLADKRVERFAITWAEDIRRWHPGQDWILAAGGFGVFDPAINALSIATAILPDAITVAAADVAIPEGRQSPLAAELVLASGAATGTATLDFLRLGEQRWDIEVVTDAGTITLGMGGLTLHGIGSPQTFANEEYPRLYSAFADRVAAKTVDLDVAPLRLVADAFLLAERHAGPAFTW